ncbi:hypothetical protein HDV01_001276 [Terramyces sp. JEL0728]|nr:hypothetical protein HDV01_001276 [Terramyces sp. JEL0728]
MAHKASVANESLEIFVCVVATFGGAAVEVVTGGAAVMTFAAENAADELEEDDDLAEEEDELAEEEDELAEEEDDLDEAKDEREEAADDDCEILAAFDDDATETELLMDAASALDADCVAATAADEAWEKLAILFATSWKISLGGWFAVVGTITLPAVYGFESPIHCATVIGLRFAPTTMLTSEGTRFTVTKSRSVCTDIPPRVPDVLVFTKFCSAVLILPEGNVVALINSL